MQKNDKIFIKLIDTKSTILLASHSGRKLYEVKITPAFKAKNFTNRGRVVESLDFELKEKASITGNVFDNGYILIDKREQNLSRMK